MKAKTAEDRDDVEIDGEILPQLTEWLVGDENGYDQDGANDESDDEWNLSAHRSLPLL